MDSSEEEELLLGFILLNDKRKKQKNKETSILGSWDISPAWKTASVFKSSSWAHLGDREYCFK